VVTINGKQYAKNIKEVAGSLFQAGGTANGTYKLRKRGVLLYDLAGELRVFLCANNPRACFFVSAGIVNGKPFYNYALADREVHWLGLGSSYLGQRATADNAWELITEQA
jgi:hypothetical protein